MERHLRRRHDDASSTRVEMGGRNGHPGSTMGYLHFIDREASAHAYSTSQLCTYLLLASLLFFPVLYLSPSQLSYDCSLSLVDLVGFRSCAHFLRFKCHPPIPPPVSISCVHITLLVSYPATFLLLVGCSLSLYFYLLFGLLSIPRILCRCCDESILTRTKSVSYHPKV